VLLLFDVDGTLVRCGGAGRRALERAFQDELGIAQALSDVRLDGRTDRLIIEDAFIARLGRLPDERTAEVERLTERYLALLGEELARAGDRYEVLSGVEALLTAAAASGRLLLGLATGNLERGARIKLEPAGLNGYFGFGGYGSDARERSGLVRRGVERGQAEAERRLGKRFNRDQVLVIGDTELDVHAAREAGVCSVGVLLGSLHRDALQASEPDLLVESLEDPLLWRALGLA
jgi:phosphoglycolate phosphatase-like HAD superfamily hydrolase